MPGQKSPLLLDADVLIDFCGSDLSALTLVARHLRPVRIVAPLLREVPKLDPTDCDRHSLELWEPSTEQLLAAGAKRGPLSFLDRLCLIVARDEGWTCATNDKALRRACRAEGVRALWGLELLVELVEVDHLSRESAVSIANDIHINNRRHITPAILARFEVRLRRPRK